MVKPDPDIYLHTLERTSSHPEKTVFVDDSKVNVDTAIRLGMRGFLYTESAAFINYLKREFYWDPIKNLLLSYKWNLLWK